MLSPRRISVIVLLRKGQPLQTGQRRENSDLTSSICLLDARERLTLRRRAIERLGRRCSDITMASLSSQKAMNNDSSSMRPRKNSQGFVLTIASPISRASISFPILSPLVRMDIPLSVYVNSR